MAGIIVISAQDLINLIKTSPETVELIDVRTPEEYEEVHIKDSKLIPLSELQQRAGEIDWSKNVIFICRSGARSFQASSFAATLGKDVKNVDGGMMAVESLGADDILESQ